MNLPDFSVLSGTLAGVMPWLERHRTKLKLSILVLIGFSIGMALSNIAESLIWANMPPAPPPLVAKIEKEDYIAPPVEDYVHIIERNFFRIDVDREIPVAPEPDPATLETQEPVEEEIKISPLPAEVIGTMGGSDEVAVALIRDKRNKQVDLYWVGDKLFDQATILKINRGEVLVLRNGKTEALQLFGDGEGQSVIVPVGQRSRPGNPGGDPSRPEIPDDSKIIKEAVDENGNVQLDIEEIRANEFIIDKQQFEQVMGNLGPLLTQARVVPNFSKGRINGYKIFAIKSGSVFQQIGLKNGDIINAVNGVGVDTPEKALQLFQQLRSETDFALDVERGGTQTAFSYQLR